MSGPPFLWIASGGLDTSRPGPLHEADHGRADGHRRGHRGVEPEPQRRPPRGPAHHEIEPVAVDGRHDGFGGVGSAPEDPGEEDQRVGVVGVHVLEDSGRRLPGQRVGLGGGVVLRRHPAHAAVAAHIADAAHLQAPKGEVTEVDVIGRCRVGGQVPVAHGRSRLKRIDQLFLIRQRAGETCANGHDRLK